MPRLGIARIRADTGAMKQTRTAVLTVLAVLAVTACPKPSPPPATSILAGLTLTR